MSYMLKSESSIKAILAIFTALALVLVFAAPTLARGGGGRGGGGGGRGGGMSRPSGGYSRPSGGYSRPSTPSYRPPAATTRPTTPGYRPGQPGTGPATRPGQGGSGTYRPNQPNYNRPWTGNNNINTGTINVNSNNGGWGWGWGSGYGLALGAAAATGAAVASSGSSGYYAPPPASYGTSAPTVVYNLPPSCTPEVIGGTTYQNCGGSYYQPVYQGASVGYQPVPAP